MKDNDDDYYKRVLNKNENAMISDDSDCDGRTPMVAGGYIIVKWAAQCHCIAI